MFKSGRNLWKIRHEDKGEGMSRMDPQLANYANGEACNETRTIGQSPGLEAPLDEVQALRECV